MNKFFSIGVAGAALVIAGAAMAEEAPRQKTVRLTAVDLNDPAQAKAVLDQLKTAAHEVCAEGFNSPHAFVITDRQCERIALQEAVYQIGHPGLRAAQSEDRARRDPREEKLTAERGQ